MEYARLYTALLTHPKWMVLSDGAQALIVRAWLFSALQETDGYVPDAARRLIGYKARPAEELEPGWWQRNGGGWVLHDWCDHQINGAEMKERRDRLRQQWRESKQRSRAQDKGEVS